MLSKALGYLIILGSLIVKVPQILKILQSNSVEGLSLEMFVLEIVGYAICTSYGFYRQFPFSTFGETLLIGVQNLIIIYLIFSYRKISMMYFSLLILGMSVQVGALMNGLIPDQIATYMFMSTSLIFSASKIPQIMTNFKTRSTGALALPTYVLNFSGSLARIFTTLKEVNEASVLINYLLSAVLNGTLMVQILIWGGSKATVTAAKPKPAKKNL